MEWHFSISINVSWPSMIIWIFTLFNELTPWLLTLIHLKIFPLYDISKTFSQCVFLTWKHFAFIFAIFSTKTVEIYFATFFHLIANVMRCHGDFNRIFVWQYTTTTATITIESMERSNTKAIKFNWNEMRVWRIVSQHVNVNERKIKRIRIVCITLHNNTMNGYTRCSMSMIWQRLYFKVHYDYAMHSSNECQRTFSIAFARIASKISVFFSSSVRLFFLPIFCFCFFR